MSTIADSEQPPPLEAPIGKNEANNDTTNTPSNNNSAQLPPTKVELSTDHDAEPQPTSTPVVKQEVHSNYYDEQTTINPTTTNDNTNNTTPSTTTTDNTATNNGSTESKEKDKDNFFETHVGGLEIIPGRIHLKGLHPETTETELRQYFGRFGKLSDVMVSRAFDGKAKNFAFVSFQKHEHAKKCIEQRTHLVNGRSMYANYATKAPENAKQLKLLALPHYMTKEDLTNFYRHFGELESVKVLQGSLPPGQIDPFATAPSNTIHFGFVNFRRPERAYVAIRYNSNDHPGDTPQKLTITNQNEEPADRSLRTEHEIIPGIKVEVALSLIRERGTAPMTNKHDPNLHSRAPIHSGYPQTNQRYDNRGHSMQTPPNYPPYDNYNNNGYYDQSYQPPPPPPNNYGHIRPNNRFNPPPPPINNSYGTPQTSIHPPPPQHYHDNQRQQPYYPPQHDGYDSYNDYYSSTPMQNDYQYGSAYDQYDPYNPSYPAHPTPPMSNPPPPQPYQSQQPRNMPPPRPKIPSSHTPTPTQTSSDSFDMDHNRLRDRQYDNQTAYAQPPQPHPARRPPPPQQYPSYYQ